MKMNIEKTQKIELKLPTNLRAIEEYLYVLNQIEEERQKTPEGEWINHGINQGMFAAGVPIGEGWVNILKILNQEKIIKLKDTNLNNMIYSARLMPTERFQRHRKELNKELEEIQSQKNCSPI